MALELIYITHMYMWAALEEADGPNLSAEDKQRRDKRIPRISIKRYTESPFYYLFQSRNDQSLLNLCAVDHEVFQELLDMFKPVYDKYTVDDSTGIIREVTFTTDGFKQGRQRDLDAIGALGLVLFWYRTRGSLTRSVTMAFGLTATPLYKWLKFSRRVLLFVLQDHPCAKVCSPSDEEVYEYNTAIRAKYPVAGRYGVWGAIDGLKLHLETSTNYAVQNFYYNGHTKGTYINSCLLFAPDGRIQMCTINAPGSFHDSTMASYGLYAKMKHIYERTGCRVVVDSAFASDSDEYLIKSNQTPKITATAEDMRLHQEATSVRQLSEHGMRMIQAQFPRLKDNLKMEDFGDRKIILNLMVLLILRRSQNAAAIN